MPLIYQDFITRADLHANRSALYIFGDNEERRGLGGQAEEMRGEPNSHGIRVKRSPSRDKDAFWTNADFPRVITMIRDDFDKPHRWLTAGKVVVFPTAKIGSDRAELEERAPKIFSYIMKKIELLELISDEIRTEQLLIRGLDPEAPEHQ
jgi:hypothetical protein